MADANTITKPVDAGQPVMGAVETAVVTPVDAGTTKTYTETEFKEIVKDRDKLKTKLRTIEQETERRVTVEAEQKGEFKQLYETLKPDYDQLKTRLAEYESRDQAELETLLKSVPEADKPVIEIGKTLAEKIMLARKFQPAQHVAGNPPVYSTKTITTETDSLKKRYPDMPG
jgi:DNA repair exonuclease SbcCD ATPase subunit